MFTREQPSPSTDANQPRLVRLGDLLGELEADATAAYEARVNGTARGPVTGIRSLDRELGGALAPGVHIAHGGAGVGKSALCLQIAAKCGTPCLYLTAEMSPLELLRRHIARETGTFLGRLKSGEFAPNPVVELAQRAAAAAPLIAFADATRAPAKVRWLADAAEIARGESEHFLIVIDSLHS